MVVMALVDDDEVRVRTAVAELVATLEAAAWTPHEAWSATFDAGLSRVDLPVGHGGLGARPELQWIVREALAALGVPSGFVRNPCGYSVAASVIAAFGTPQQQARHFRPIFTCDEIWCQLFSEPDAGSDLAALRTRAERDGDAWRLTGRKVWNTMAHISDYGLLLARTTPGHGHRGISCFLVDLHLPGIEVRPIRQMTGDAEFNEVILDDALLPESALIGKVDEGWSVAIGTLMAERFAISEALDDATPLVDEVVELWCGLPADERPPGRRDQLLQLVVRSRVLDMMRASVNARARDGIPGPEGSLLNLAQSELTPAIFNFGVNVFGTEGTLYGDYEMRQPTTWSGGGVKSGDVRRAFLSSRAQLIAGGTVEIQRNTIAERILGLPRDSYRASTARSAEAVP
ncbi:MAG TPA: acyl-CoA dehydrogenase family protein [Mycobacteriales bacterium]|jgi:alkylation response protein AidB-like acyl-CoA dehydrogenase|nr:acyl-CoA dehydrogenase family protein [Mycobacteriales bacterium]HVX69057.1 acyl-CoA dehydrogenase family protein [Mycobacteriales bacterium]